MKRMSDDIRLRTAELLDTLPWDQPFDWVDTVSIELTTQMLAILFDFPWEDRRKLTEWSDWAGDIELVHSEELRSERLKHLYEMGAYFKKLWDAKIDAEPTPDLISMMIHSDAMARDGRARVHGQPDPADRRRQRHHPQLDVGPGLWPAPVPRPAREAGGRTRR